MTVTENEKTITPRFSFTFVEMKRKIDFILNCKVTYKGMTINEYADILEKKIWGNI